MGRQGQANLKPRRGDIISTVGSIMSPLRDYKLGNQLSNNDQASTGPNIQSSKLDPGLAHSFQGQEFYFLFRPE